MRSIVSQVGIIRTWVYVAGRHAKPARVTRSLFSPAYAQLRDSLIAARRSKGLTQIELAKILGRPQSFVSKFEKGERRLDLVEVVEIATALGVEPGDLVAQVQTTLAAGEPK